MVCASWVVNPKQNTSANRLRDANDQGRNTGVGVKLNVMGLKRFICVRMGVKSKCDEM
jgi:hypothetical protein